jgi:hypothetical protein
VRGACKRRSPGWGRWPPNPTIVDIDVAAGAAIAWSKISKSGAVPSDVGAQPANAKLTTIAGLTGTTPIRSDGSNGALKAAEIPNLDASKTTTGTFLDSQIPASIARDSEVTAAIADHAALADPHPTYLTAAEGNAAYAPLGATGTTNLTIANRTATTIDIASDTGTDATIPAATTALSGMMSAADKSKLDGVAAGAQVNTVTSVAGKTGVVTLAKADVGLGSVDNTTDANKPISTATATALAARELTAARTLAPAATDPGNTATINGFLSWLISAMRSAQTTLSGLGSLATKSTIVSADITDGTITNADISATAEIVASKLSGVQPLSSRLTGFDGLAGPGLVRLPSGSGTSPTIATAAEIQFAGGLGTLSTRNILDVGTVENIQISKSYLTNSAADSTYLYLSKYSLSDRLSGANQKYSITYTGTATSVDAPFDGSSDSAATVPAGTTQIWEIDFNPYVPYTTNGYNGYIAERGGFVASFAYGVLPANLKVEVLLRDGGTGLDTWFTRIDKSSGFVGYKAYLERLGFGNFLKKMRIGVTAGASACYLAGLEYFPESTNAEEESYALGTAVGLASQRCHTPIRVQNAGGSLATTIGPGTIRINTGATLTAMFRATKTIAGTNPESITVTGAAVGDIVELSKPVNGEVIGPNTVQFDGSAISGSITAIVKRYT